MQVKVCTKCKTEKPGNEFPKRTKNKDGLYSWCKTCTSQAVRNYRKLNPDKMRVQDRNSWLKKTYGITAKEYDSQFEKQNGLCAICGKPESLGKKLAVDHDHRNGKIRGLLCFRCNTRLAHIEDVKFVIQANLYLAEHSD